MIDIIEGLPANVVAVDCKGQVTRDDYESVLMPLVESTLKKHDKVRLLYRIGADFKGIDAGAVLDDMKIGFSHLSHWERIAIITDVEWIRLAIRAFAFVIPGAVKFFEISDEARARAWIAEK